jgi:hypothetical protein
MLRSGALSEGFGLRLPGLSTFRCPSGRKTGSDRAAEPILVRYNRTSARSAAAPRRRQRARSAGRREAAEGTLTRPGELPRFVGVPRAHILGPVTHTEQPLVAPVRCHAVGREQQRAMSGGKSDPGVGLDPIDLAHKRGSGKGHARHLANCFDERWPVALVTHTASVAQREEAAWVRSAIYVSVGVAELTGSTTELAEATPTSTPPSVAAFSGAFSGAFMTNANPGSTGQSAGPELALLAGEDCPEWPLRARFDGIQAPCGWIRRDCGQCGVDELESCRPGWHLA